MSMNLFKYVILKLTFNMNLYDYYWKNIKLIIYYTKQKLIFLFLL